MPRKPRAFFRRPWRLGLLAATAAIVAWSGWRERSAVDRSARERPSPREGVAGPAVGPVAAEPRSEIPSAERALFSFVEPENAAELSRALPAPSQEIHYVRVNRALFAGKRSPFWRRPGEGAFTIPWPDGGERRVTIDGSELLGPDRFTSVGHLAGRPASRVLLAWNEGFLHAAIDDPGAGRFALRMAGAELGQFYRVDPAWVRPCGGERSPRRESAPPSRAGVTRPGPAATPPETAAAADNPQRAEVHVLMLYTPSVLETLPLGNLPVERRAAAVQSAFDLAIAQTNAAFEASEITARVKLVGVAETRYDESASSGSKVNDDALTALYLETDGNMDEIHALRDRVGADVVCLALGRGDFGNSGLSFLLDAPYDPGNDAFAFSVVSYGSIAGTNVVAHELGHLFGCAHDRENARSGQGAFSFSYGYRFIGQDSRQYHDIMSYPPGDELSYFSNPEVIAPAPVNVPLGIAAGRLGESNTALTIERTAFITASYRLQTQAAPNRGTLVNVATRAFVGTGDDVLIGGFVVEGAEPKRMLVRAAGPALAAFGVGDALADPTLRIFRGGTPVAENDHWGNPAGVAPATAAEIALAAAQVRAFPFAAGSADAAVLVTLAPGAYSAVVEGARGTTGSGLVEAYEAAASGTRIINLATRGRADRNGREMVGGFVVDGALGSTKRILIRVLGPTLLRAPFNLAGALDDPELELRNAAGALLLTSDDWSSGADGGASPENDFQPLVELYGEKQIFATGLAPKNRREPCVLVDLPPGSFTVIVRPYELRSDNPATDQPARPGVGVIEVYEISR